MKAVHRSLSASLALMAAMFFSGCVGATRMVQRDRGPSGQQLENKALDLSFVQPGSTTRAEIVSKLSMINTGYEDPHLFWGRWATSKWGYWWMVVAPATNGGGGAGAGDAHRMWTVHNIVITFDDTGVVQTKQLLNDDVSLWRALQQHVATLPSTELGEFALYGDGRSPQRIHLNRDRIEVVRAGRKKSKTIQVLPATISRISSSGVADKRNNPGTSCHVLHLTEKTAFGDKISFCADGPDLLSTYRFLHQYGSPNMQWE